MWEFKFYSRGGQGAVTAAKILINAAIIEGKFGQAIPSYGQERKGCVICFDTSLKDLDIDITEGVRPGSTLVVNTDEVDYVNSSFENVAKIDANKITHEMLGEVPPNVAMLGALAKATGCVSLDSLMQAVKLKIPGKAGELNAKTCAAAYENA